MPRELFYFFLVNMDMNILIDFPNAFEESPVITNQLPSCHAKLSSYSSTARRAVSLASFSGSENLVINDSHHAEVSGRASMAPSKISRASRRSLSSVGNGQSLEWPDGCPWLQSKCKASASEDQVRSIIDQEIFDWQFVCRTGRSFWWSPESGNNRFSGAISGECHLPISNRGADSRSLDCNLKRRANSEYMDGHHSKDAAVHIIALRLLSSCFTLPPASLTSPTPNYTIFQQVPDSRMISSLRMHTHYRYSPSFGHNARNNSPIEGWSSCESSLRPPSPSTIDKQIATLKTFKTGKRRRQRHNTSQTLLHQRSFGSESESTEFTSERDDEPYRKAALALFEASSKQSKSPLPTHPAEEYPNDGSVSKTKYTLQPVIRSEPHPVYIQPVKELVVENWDFSRRNFGGSLNAPLPSRRSEGMASRTSESELTGSFIIEGKIRRRRARERGDIYSSVDDGPPDTSLASSYQGSEAAAACHDPRELNYLGQTTECSDRDSYSEKPSKVTLRQETTLRPRGGSTSTDRLGLCRARRKSCLSEMLTTDDLADLKPPKTTECADDGDFQGEKDSA